MTVTAKLTKKQKRIASLLISPGENTIEQLCLSEGVTLADLGQMLSDDTFTTYLHRLIDGYTDGAVGAVWDALIEKCRAGDMKAIKLYFDLKGAKTTDDFGAVVITGADDLE